jgi:y4mF family transcriptional regulator
MSEFKEMYFVSVGEQIRSRRKDLGITQPHLAEIAEVSVNTLYKIERGEANPTLEVLYKLLNVLGLELQIGVKLS